jgi:hypothetical protein
LEPVSFNTLRDDQYLGSTDNYELSIVKYQRTEVTEEWGWQPIAAYEIATVAEIEALFAAPEPEPTYPPLNELWYTTPNGQAISGEYITYGIHNKNYESITLTSNIYQGDKGILTFADDIYEMEYWGGQSDCGDIEKVWLPYFTSANADSLALTEILSGQSQLNDVYYPGTISELSYFMFPEDAGIEWDTLGAAGTRTFHCSDGDYTLPDLN